VDNKAVMNLVVSGSVYGLDICLDLRIISKTFNDSKMMGVISYSSSFFVLSMWE
jgi:hypothetical protein